jgi:hypothetical protein
MMGKQVAVVLRGAGEDGGNMADFGTLGGPLVVKNEIAPFFSRRNEIRLLKFSWRRA